MKERSCSRPGVPGVPRICVFSISLCLGALTANASAAKWQPYIDLQAKIGDERSLGRGSLFLPLAQGQDQLFFTDARLVFDDNSASEGNLGLAYRHRLGGHAPAGIFGVYGFYDYRKSENDFSYRQLTGGMEWLANNWEARANLYAPEDDKNTLTAGDASFIALNGTTVVYRSATLAYLEQALPGYDLEAGYRFALGARSELWVHGGYFDFDDDDAPAVSGPRLRLEYRMQDPFGWRGAELGLGLEGQDDDVRGGQGFATARLRIPLSRAGKNRPALSGLDRRMVQAIQRDVDVVTTVSDTPVEIDARDITVTDPGSGQAINVYFVEESGAGNCTQDSPCSVGTAQGDALYGAADVIVPLASAGILSSDIVLTQPRQQVVGGGDTGEAVLSLASGDSLSLSGLGARPVFGATLSLSGESIAQGFDIDHAQLAAALSANGITGATVRDVNILGSGGAGLELVNVGGAFDYSGNIGGVSATAVSISGGDVAFSYAGDVSGSISIDGLSAGSAGFTGALSGARVDLANNTADIAFAGPINLSDGMSLQNNAGSTIAMTDVSINAGAVGILSDNSGDVTFTGQTTINGSSTAAIRVSAGGADNLSFADVVIDNPAQAGIDLRGAGGAVNFGNVDITNFGGTTGVWTENASADITLNSLDITGTGAAGSRGVDITGSTGSLSVTLAGTLQNLEIGFDLDRLGTGTTNSSLSFQGGSINAGVPVNTVGIGAGSYDFTGTAMIKNNALSTATGFGGNFWFVDATGGGTGTSTNRASIDFVETNSGANDIIALVEDGTGDIVATNGLQLKSGQQLIGFGAGNATLDFTGSNAQVLGSFVYQINDPTANGAATLTNTGGTETLTLADANRVRDFNLSTTGAVDAIAGTAFTDAVIDNMNISNAGADAFSFTNASGTISVNNSNVINAAGAALRVNGGNADVSLDGDISNSVGRSVVLENRTGGNVTLSGTINDTGTGLLVQNNSGGSAEFSGAGVVINTGANVAVTLSGNTGSTVGFTGGGLAITTTSGPGLSAGGGGTLNITGANNSITTTTGTALNVVNTDIGASGLSLRSISVNGAANGIVLNNTGTSGGLSVTGDGATGGSGGTIQNTTAAGISLSNTHNVSLNYMNISNTAAAGVTGSGVSGSFTVQNSTIQNTVGHNIGLSGVTGTVDISNNTLLDANEDGGTDFLDENNGIDIANTTGTLSSLTISNNLIRGTAGTTSDVGVALHLDGTAALTTATISQNTIQGHDFNAVRVALDNDDSGDAPAVAALSIVNNTELSSEATAIELIARGSSDLNFSIADNALISSDFGSGIHVNAGLFATGGTSNATVTGGIVNNTLSNIGDGANDRGIDILSQENTAVVVNIDGNNINNVTNGGIVLRVRDASSLDAVVNNNALTNTDTFGGGVIGLSAETRETSNGCFAITNNNNALSYLLTQSSGTFNLEPLMGNTGTVTPTGTITNVASGTCARVM